MKPKAMKSGGLRVFASKLSNHVRIIIPILLAGPIPVRNEVGPESTWKHWYIGDETEPSFPTKGQLA